MTEGELILMLFKIEIELDELRQWLADRRSAWVEYQEAVNALVVELARHDRDSN